MEKMSIYYSITGHDESNHYIATMDRQVFVLGRDLEFFESIDAAGEFYINSSYLYVLDDKNL